MSNSLINKNLENKISDIIVRAYQAEKNQQQSIAIQAWNELLQEDIDADLRANTYLNLAKLHHQDGNNDLSIEMIESAIQSNPNSSEAYFTLGFFQFEKQKFKGAIANFQKALEFTQNDAGLYNNLANCYDRLGEFELAIQHYTNALNIDNKYISSIYNRGNVFCKIKDYKNALKDLSYAIDLDNDFYQAYYNRGAIYKLINKPHLAEKDLKMAKELAQKDINSKT